MAGEWVSTLLFLILILSYNVIVIKLPGFVVYVESAFPFLKKIQSSIFNSIV